MQFFNDIVERRLRGNLSPTSSAKGILVLNLEVSPAVLVPRPETEILVQLSSKRQAFRRPHLHPGVEREAAHQRRPGQGATVGADRSTDLSLEALGIAARMRQVHGRG